MLRICDVLKYSEPRAKSFSVLLGENGARLEIQTLGDEWLRFLLRGPRRGKTWVALSSYDRGQGHRRGGGLDDGRTYLPTVWLWQRGA
jgi:hypothetical protein